MVAAKKPKVAVIGAGPCGIFSSGAIGDTADVTIFERASVMGGQWAFSEEKLASLIIFSTGCNSFQYLGLHLIFLEFYPHGICQFFLASS